MCARYAVHNQLAPLSELSPTWCSVCVCFTFPQLDIVHYRKAHFKSAPVMKTLSPQCVTVPKPFLSLGFLATPS